MRVRVVPAQHLHEVLGLRALRDPAPPCRDGWTCTASTRVWAGTLRPRSTPCGPLAASRRSPACVRRFPRASKPEAVLLLLHAARSPGELKARSDVAHVWGSATPESRDAILSSVDRLGAGLAFAVILGTLEEHRDDERPVEDRLRQAARASLVACTGACSPEVCRRRCGWSHGRPSSARRAHGAHRSPHGSQGPRRGVLRPSHPWCQGAVRRRALASSGQETGDG